MQTRNFTPHAISLFKEADVEYNDKQRKFFVKAGKTPYMIIDPEDKILSVKFEEVTFEENGYPFVQKKIVDLDPIPQDATEDYIFVSRMYADAFRKIHPDSNIKLIVVGTPVYTNIDGKIAPCGLLNFEMV